MKLMKYDSLNKIILVYLCFLSYKKLIKIIQNQQRTSNRRIWTREIYAENEREMHGFFAKIFLIIKNNDEDQFRKATRMGIKEFNILNSLLKRKLQKQNYVRNAIDPELRLVLTLVYLAHGAAWQILAWSFRVGLSTVREIILEVSKIIWDELSGIYLSPPTETEWKKIADEFYKNTGMPNVVGAIDGKHIRIKCPPHAGSLYYNYKKYHSIVLLATCDSNYLFSAVDVGAYGSQSDGGILQKSAFGDQILNLTINIPKTMVFPNSNEEFPSYFIGDSAFPLRTNLMRPYPGRTLPADRDHFNKKLSGARVKIENTFGILTAKFRVLTNSINLFPQNAEIIVRATLVLHNFIKLHDSSNYVPNSFVDHWSEQNEMIQGTWRSEVEPLPQYRHFSRFNAARDAFSIRENLKDYLYNM